ncbi:ankyrin [Neoconidiobolus thromboides FSU 785]|nr:ankyrin [Neoconidiobolus thromboides FSU 785]
MSKGEQEEQLREYSALGNIKAVKALLSLGVNPNAANVVNGWTAFHWACKRGHVNIVELLLLHGVDIELKNNQSQTGYQLTKSQQILEILGKSKIEINVQADRQSFIPNYLANPDYDKVWNLPQDLPLDKSSQSDVKKFKEDIPITKNDNLNPIDFNTVSVIIVKHKQRNIFHIKNYLKLLYTVMLVN